MNKLIVCALAALSLSGGALAQPDEDPLAGAVADFIAAFNAGDIEAIVELHADSPAIIDEVPPFIFTGPDAVDEWLTALVAFDAAQGRSDGSVAMGDIVRTDRVGSRAYVVTEVVYSYRDNGVPTAQPARISLALTETSEGWRFAGWAWAGEEGQAVALDD